MILAQHQSVRIYEIGGFWVIYVGTAQANRPSLVPINEVGSQSRDIPHHLEPTHTSISKTADPENTKTL